MSQSKVPYGHWSSPVSPETLSHSLKLEDVAWSTSGETLVWLERRAGRGVLVSRQRGEQCDRDLTEEHQVGARIGYGGGSFTVGERDAYYVEKDGRIYRQGLDGGLPNAVTPAFGAAAAPTLSPDERKLLYVHHHAGRDSLAICSTQGDQWPTRLVQAADFYMQARWHPSGDQVAWIEWNHPQMPWDGTRLMLAELGFAEGCTTKEVCRVAGSTDCAIFQPEFSPDGKELAFISDEDGWSNIYLYDLQRRTTRQVTEGAQEFGRPAWRQGMRTFTFSPDGLFIFAIRNAETHHAMVRIRLDDGSTQELEPFEAYSELAAPAISKEHTIAVIGSSPCHSPRVLAAPCGERPLVLRRSTAERLRESDLVRPTRVQFPTADGTTIHGLLYAPATDKPFSSDGRPPALVSIHGGPTSQAISGFSPRAQFFATRGYAYLEVNYRGSTGYGREFRQSLQTQWGVHDVEDAVAAARYLRDEEIADPARLVIIGNSAGGFTVLKTLADHPGVFAAGLSLYGVANLFTLASETHKFESRYLDSLVGPLPQSSATYRDRSPVNIANRITDPVAIFQGSEDKVVPPSQAEEIVESLRARQVPFEYHLYEGEEHGWRLPETIKRHYRDIESFLRRYVLFK